MSPTLPGGTPVAFDVDRAGWDARPCPFRLESVPCPGDAAQTCAEVYLDRVLDYEALRADYGDKFDGLTSSLAVTVTVTDSKPTTVAATAR